jgi:hypothetical protein
VQGVSIITRSSVEVSTAGALIFLKCIFYMRDLEALAVEGDQLNHLAPLSHDHEAMTSSFLAFIII